MHGGVRRVRVGASPVLLFSVVVGVLRMRVRVAMRIPGVPPTTAVRTLGVFPLDVPVPPVVAIELFRVVEDGVEEVCGIDPGVCHLPAQTNVNIKISRFQDFKVCA